MPRTERLLASSAALPPALASAMCRALPTVESALIDGLADFRLAGDDTRDFEDSDAAVGALLQAVSRECAPRLVLGSELFSNGRRRATSASPPSSPLPTGIPEIDSLLYLGAGLPRGLLTELYGAPGSGKTQVALAAAATTAAAGGAVLWLDCCSGGGGGGGREGASPFPGRRLAALVAAASGLPPPSLSAATAAATEATAEGNAPPSSDLPSARLDEALDRIVVVPCSGISEAASALDVAAAKARRERRRPLFDLLVLDSAAALFGPVLGGGGGSASSSAPASSSGAGHAAMVSFVRSFKAAASALGAAALATNHERAPTQASAAAEGFNQSTTPLPPAPALGESWRPQASLRVRLAAVAVPAEAEGASDDGGRSLCRGPSLLRTAQVVRGPGASRGAPPVPWAIPLAG